MAKKSKKKTAAPAADPRQSAAPNTAGLPLLNAAIILVALAVGMYLALHLVGVKLALDFDPTYESSCNYGGKLNCDAVQTHSASTMFKGMALESPLALWGFMIYLFLAIATGIAAFVKNWGRSFHALVAAIGIAAVLHSIYLAYLSTFVIDAYCVYCMGMYAVNITVAVAAIVGNKGGFKALGGLLAELNPSKAMMPLLTAAVVLIAAVGLSFAVYEGSYEQAKNAGLDAAKQQLQQPKAQAAKAADPKLAEAASKYDDQGNAVTRKGRAYYNALVTDLDFALGPADAKVTVVEFADFQCGYCKRLGENMKPLKAKYKDQVRWVFKHFPLDKACNPILKETMHNRACAAARAANCAGKQGKFWEMHDTLFANQHQFADAQLEKFAGQSGVADIGAWQACYASKETDPKIAADIEAARGGRVFGTPRTFVNGHLVAGSAATEILDYYIQNALDQAADLPSPSDLAALPPVPEGAMIKARTATGEFYIDAYEGSLDAAGKAVSQPGVLPAQASWFDADKACKAVGKRLCTEEEWVSACTGSPAVDNDGSGSFADDEPEGNLFPYGPFYLGKICNDDQHKDRGNPIETGVLPACRSLSGIFDMSGNMAEWTGTDLATAQLTGSMFTAGSGATCRGKSTRFGAGHRTESTGFRCCADSDKSGQATGDAVEFVVDAVAGSQVPDFEINKDGGGKFSDEDLLGDVTILSFFASWCGPCRRELPDLQNFYTTHKDKGLRVVAIGVDKEEAAARSFAESLSLTYELAYDPNAVSHGRFGVQAMPTTFLINAEGQIVKRQEGINAAEMKAFKDAALQLLGS